MKRMLILGMLILVPGSSLWANPHLTTSKLANGLELVSFPSNKVPLVTVVLACKGGAMTETPETNGLTHLWEHMFFKGNKALPNQEAFKKRIRELGITYNGDTSAEKVRYYFTLPAVYLKEGLDFMANAISDPLLEEEELRKERKVVLDEWDRNASEPEFDLYRLNRGIVFQDKAYLRDPLGDREVIAKATREQLLKIKNDIFVPQNCSLLVSGDFNSEQLKKVADQSFKNWGAKKDWQPLTLAKYPDFPKTTSYVMSRPHVANATIEYSFQGPMISTQKEDTFIADILAGLVKHRSGTYYKKFVDSGLTLGSNFGYYTQAQVGELSLYVKSAPENVKKLKKALIPEFKEWVKPGYFTTEQLEEVKRSLIIDHKREMNAPSAYIKTLAFWWAVTGLDYYSTYIENMNKVKLGQVTNFVNQYLIGKNYIEAIFLSPENAAKIKLKDTSSDLAKKWLKQPKSPEKQS